MSLEPLLTPANLAERWRCSVDTIYEAINSGKLRAFWLGGWKIEEADAEAFKAAQQRVAPQKLKPGPKPKLKLRHMTKGG